MSKQTNNCPRYEVSTAIMKLWGQFRGTLLILESSNIHFWRRHFPTRVVIAIILDLSSNVTCSNSIHWLANYNFDHWVLLAQSTCKANDTHKLFTILTWPVLTDSPTEKIIYGLQCIISWVGNFFNLPCLLLKLHITLHCSKLTFPFWLHFK